MTSAMPFRLGCSHNRGHNICEEFGIPIRQTGQYNLLYTSFCQTAYSHIIWHSVAFPKLMTLDPTMLMSA
jgi:hypothetical protein